MLWYLLIVGLFLWLILFVAIGGFCYLFFFVEKNRNYDLKTYFYSKVFVYFVCRGFVIVLWFGSPFVNFLELQIVLLLIG